MFTRWLFRKIIMFKINADGFENWQKLVMTYPDRAKKAMSLAINQTAKREAIKSIRDSMMEQVNLKKMYLIKHTTVQATATPRRMSAKISARDTPTMLSRFALNRNIPKSKAGRARMRREGVKVRVKPTKVRVMKGAFLHALKGDTRNTAVMVRTKNGRPPAGVTHGGGRYVRSMNAWILYAPSIDQLMWDTSYQQIPKIQRAVEREFLRQFARLK